MVEHRGAFGALPGQQEGAAYSGFMTASRLAFERAIDLPPAIVWDGLVEPALVSGWLGEARIDPVVGGRYDLAWLGSPEFPGAEGRIVTMAEYERLVVATSVYGELDFRLEARAGGSRDSWTRLTLVVTSGLDAAFERRVEQNWTDALDQLGHLLRGHPVDWASGATAPTPDRTARAPLDTDLA